MKRLGMVVVAVAVMGSPVMAQDATSKLMALAAERSVSLMQISYEYTQDASVPVPPQKYTAQAICLTKEGLFMTYGIVAGMRAQDISDLTLTPPGDIGPSVKAEFLWTDRETNISFLRATEKKGDFVPVEFNTRAELKIGAKVATVGMFEDDPAHTPYVNVGYISSVLRLPGPIVLVAGGSTTNDGSPVLNEAGEFIGVTMSQFLRYQTRTPQGVQEVQLDPKALGHFFRPASEFAHVLDYARKNPTKPRVLSWIGVLDFRALDENSIFKSDVPAVVVGKVADGGPAASAGLREHDIIVAVDGKGLEKFSSPMLVRTAFVLRLIRLAPGQTATFTVRRDDKQTDVKVTAAAQPQDDTQVARYVVRQLGFLVRERAEIDKYILPAEMADTAGLLVLQVQQNSPGDRAGLRPGDLVVSVNNEPVSKMAAFKSMMSTALGKMPPAAVSISVRRGGDTIPLVLQPPTPGGQ